MNQKELLKLLDNYTSFDAQEEQHLHRMVEFITVNEELFSRNNRVGHITASAIVTDSSYEHILMIWHEKLQRWLQPGGHVEIELDESLSAAAARELEEETGLSTEDFTLASVEPFDLDVHRIPARKSEEAHYHFDVRFLFTYHPECAISSAYKWVPTKELYDFNEASLSRFAEKIEQKKRI